MYNYVNVLFSIELCIYKKKKKKKKKGFISCTIWYYSIYYLSEFSFIYKCYLFINIIY